MSEGALLALGEQATLQSSSDFCLNSDPFAAKRHGFLFSCVRGPCDTIDVEQSIFIGIWGGGTCLSCLFGRGSWRFLSDRRGSERERERERGIQVGVAVGNL